MFRPRLLHCAPITACALILLAACGSSTEESSDPSESSDASDDTSATDEPLTPAAACTDVLNNRDRETFNAAADASIDILFAAMDSDTTPSADDLATWQDALEAGADQLDDEITALSEVDDSPEWSDVIAPLERLSEVYRERAAAADESWPLAEPFDYGYESEEQSATTIAAIEELDLEGRDCETLIAYKGPDPEHRDFVADVATACSDIFERRSDGDFEDDLSTNIEFVAAVTSGENPEVTDELTEALEALVSEWQDTADDLAGITEDPSDAAAWDAVIELADERLAVYSDRLAALEDEDTERINELFEASVFSLPGWDWESLDLHLRDCRSLRT